MKAADGHQLWLSIICGFMPFNKRGVSATPFHGGLEWKQLHRKMILDDTKTSLAKQGSHSDWKTWKNGKAFPVREF